MTQTPALDSPLALALTELADTEVAFIRMRTDRLGVTRGQALFDDAGWCRFTIRVALDTVTADDIEDFGQASGPRPLGEAR